MTSSRATLRVIDAGIQTTVQDFGRPGFGHWGISPAGAADPVSLGWGNKIVGNPQKTAGLEITLTGATFEFLRPCLFGVTGAEASITVDGSAVSSYMCLHAEPGGILKIGAVRKGARSYLSLAGGVDVPLFLGSASTHLPSHLGGYQGRALSRGDLLKTGRGALNNVPPVPPLPEILQPRKSVRVTKGIHFSLFDIEEAAKNFAFNVTAGSDRLGLVLNGPVPGPHRSVTDLPSTGVSLGTVQISGDGIPTVLFVDQQTTGGYPQIFSVIAADHFSLGQWRPGDAVNFELVDFATAERLFREQTQALASAYE